jgi:ribosomal protein L21E
MKVYKSRYILKKSKLQKGILPLSHTHTKLELRSRCCIVTPLGDYEHAPERKFIGKIGTIVQIYKRCYKLKIGKNHIITTKMHLKRVL